VIEGKIIVQVIVIMTACVKKADSCARGEDSTSYFFVPPDSATTSKNSQVLKVRGGDKAFLVPALIKFTKK
jgi:hypothetical protein